MKLVDSTHGSNVGHGVDTIVAIRHIVVQIKRFLLPFDKIEETASRIFKSAADTLFRQGIGALTVTFSRCGHIFTEVSVNNIDRHLVSSLSLYISVLIFGLDFHYLRVSCVRPVKGRAAGYACPWIRNMWLHYRLERAPKNIETIHCDGDSVV